MRGTTPYNGSRGYSRRDFNPRPSCEGRRATADTLNTAFKFQSTSLLRGTTWQFLRSFYNELISIHVPLARDDREGDANKKRPLYFNPRPSCEGRQRKTVFIYGLTNFNPRPSCEGRRRVRMCRSFSEYFNPRPSCEGRHCVSVRPIRPFLFQSTSLLRGTTKRGHSSAAGTGDFNPRPSCEGRPTSCSWSISMFLFQSTSLLRGTTSLISRIRLSLSISIHVPLARDDPCQKWLYGHNGKFQSTSLLRGTT